MSKPHIIIIGMVCITIIELYALHKGINGILLTAVLSGMFLVIGVKLPTPKFME